MKLLTTVSLLCLLLNGGAALAAPAAPAGHAMAPAASGALPHKGKVLSAVAAGQYTYIEVAQTSGANKKTLWLAAPAIALKKGNTIGFDDGAEMHNFFSKTLNRTFPSVQFIGRVVVLADAK